MITPLKILILEDLQTDVELVKYYANTIQRKCIFAEAKSKNSFHCVLDEFEPDLIISDYQLDGYNGLRALEYLKSHRPDTPLIIITGTLGEDLAVQIMKKGASDFLLKKNISSLPASIVRTLREVEEKKKNEEAEKIRKELFEVSVDMIGIADIDGYLKVINPAFEKTLGYSNSELLNKPFIEFIHPEDVKSTKGVLFGLVNGIPIEGFENRVQCADGKYKWLEWNINQKGRKLFCNGRDISEWKKAQKKLNKSENFNKDILTSLTSQIVVINRSGVIIEVNASWDKFALENGVVDLNKTSKGSNYLEICRKAIEKNDPISREVYDGIISVFEGRLDCFEIEYPCHSPTEKRWFILRANLFESDANLLVVSHSNITDLKQAQQLILEMNDELEERILQRTSQLEIKNKEITDSINYARRIQKAILPSEKYLQAQIPNSFLFYSPKDIVAGDFYWVQSIDDHLMFAVADCTGHGVPGAMVSVICNSGLNRAVHEYKIEDPGKILDMTRNLVIQEFEKSEEEVKDGMDIALCVLKENKLSFSGAHMPLLIIRNGACIEIKGTKQPIGKFEPTLPFESHEIELKKDDIVYLYTDGIIDQFGGEYGKKLKAQVFKSVLLSIQALDMKQQGEFIEQFFLDWKGELEQVDDVCLLGLKI
ncbi:MAG: PAS domain S-box protein [Bacteroidetes bacterium]|nr:PAS domain S-box protein [Bacteroidota bacterium]